MSHVFTSDPDEPTYNTAYLFDGRSDLYAEYDISREFDDGADSDANEEATAPPDYGARRRAVLTFYGHRCGRCLAPLGRLSADDRMVGYVLSVAEDGPKWALEALVAACEPCYDLLTAETPADLARFRPAFRESAQFPQWACDPRVAVERVPLTGREVWRRERLAEQVSETPDCDANDAAVERAHLARETSAARAVALGDRLLADEWRSPLTRRSTADWEALPAERRRSYEQRAVDVVTDDETNLTDRK
jgi:hypothetical protein